MALDISGNWEAGDDLRLLEAMLLPFSEYMLNGLQECMAQLETISPDAVLRVKAIMTSYEAAKTAEATANIADTEGKVLVQADVLKWQVTGTGISGPQQEMATLRGDLLSYFSFCPYTPSADAGFGGQTALIRS